MTTIDLEAHFYTQAAFAYLEKRKKFPRLEKDKKPGGYHLRFTDQIDLFQTKSFIEILCDVGKKRIAALPNKTLQKIYSGNAKKLGISM